jgi:hypothetical protein
VNYERWNPEAKALLVCQLLWFAHGALMDADNVFVWSWRAHWLVNAVWGFSYLWRTGTQRRRRWAARQIAMQRYFAGIHR